MSTSKTTACIVTRDGMEIGKTELAIGDKIALTDSQMEGHAGKFELAGMAEDRAKASRSVKGIQKLQDENTVLSERVEFLEEANGSLEEALTSKPESDDSQLGDELTQEIEEKTSLVLELSERITELTKTNKSLTRKLKKLQA